jgi:ABC-type amino acid transport substrate-binding protein
MKWLVLILSLSTLLFGGTVNASLVIGIPYFKPPYVINQYQGFDVDLMKAICKGLNETCTFEPMEFDKLYAALDNGKIDLAIGAITISEERLKYYIFSLPYKISKGDFVVLKSSDIRSVHQLDGKKVGAIWASDFEDFLDEHPDLDIQEEFYEEPLPLIAALDDHQVDAVFIDLDEVKYWLKQSDTPLVPLGHPIKFGDGFGIMALPKNKALVESVNGVLMQIQSNGVYDKLYTDYFND